MLEEDGNLKLLIMDNFITIENWPYKWFGFWKEYGPNYAKYPSAFVFVDKERNQRYDKVRLKEYLDKGIVVASTSRVNFPSPFTGKPGDGAISFRTDGTWVWFDDLFDYIDEHDLAVPDQWYEHIKKNNFTVPDIKYEDLDLEKLPLPRL